MLGEKSSGGILPQQPHSHKEQWTQTQSEGATQFLDTSPEQVPSLWGALPLLSPCLQQDGPWQRLRCTVRRALGGVRAAQAEESNSCRVSEHLSITTPSQCAGRNAETSTVPLDTHLFFRVNWPELLCKLLAPNVQSRAVFSGCALIPK